MKEFNQLNEEERLKAENDFLKMKIMLETGGEFVTSKENELPATIENEFLQNIVAFEKQFDEHKTIKVFDKIQKPQHFKPVHEIPESEIATAWNELRNYLFQYNIELSVCSPNVSIFELYRFATEELFEYAMDDMDMPGWTTHFIYDEFHPDPVYDNSRLVQDDLLQAIFRKEELSFGIHYAKDGFVFNGKQYGDFNLYQATINRFKSMYDEIELVQSDITSCLVKDTACEIIGRYKATLKTKEKIITLEADFRVLLMLDELGYWDMKNIQIEGYNPE